MDPRDRCLAPARRRHCDFARLQLGQVVGTDSTGRFCIPNLPPGLYSVRVGAKGFHPLSRADISLHCGALLADEVVIVAFCLFK